MPRHDLKGAELAMEQAVQAVGDIFGVHEVPLRAVVLNVVYSKGDVDWAASSSVRAVPDDLRDLLGKSVRVSAEEIDEPS